MLERPVMKRLFCLKAKNGLIVIVSYTYEYDIVCCGTAKSKRNLAYTKLVRYGIRPRCSSSNFRVLACSSYVYTSAVFCCPASLRMLRMLHTSSMQCRCQCQWQCFKDGWQKGVHPPKTMTKGGHCFSSTARFSTYMWSLASIQRPSRMYALPRYTAVVVVVVFFTLNHSFYPKTSAVPPVSFLILHPG